MTIVVEREAFWAWEEAQRRWRMAVFYAWLAGMLIGTSAGLLAAQLLKGS
jgi:hypothetical protein